jgi:hypothetical protein
MARTAMRAATGRGASLARPGARCPPRYRVPALALALGLLSGCASTRLVPVPADHVRIDPATGATTAAAGPVQLTVRVAAWRGAPWDLPAYVMPFLVQLSNDSPSAPVAYGYPSFRLQDDHRFQYVALAPVDVERILRSRGGGGVQVAASSPPPILRRRIVPDPYWDYWWWDRYGWGWYYAPPPLQDVYLRALPIDPLQPGARVEGFVYFPRLRPDASQLTFEFHYRLGDAPQVLTLPFGVLRGEARPPARG